MNRTDLYNAVHGLAADRTYSTGVKQDLQKACRTPHLPTDLTFECRNAISGEGPRAYDWADKPHRLVYDLCSRIEELEANQPRLTAI